MISDKTDILLLRYFDNDFYVNLDFSFLNKTFKKNVIGIINKFCNMGYIKLNPLDSSQGKLTPKGAMFATLQLKNHTFLRHCYDVKWSINERVANHTINEKSFIDNLCKEKLIRIHGQGFPHSLKKYITTEKGDVFVFTNIVEINDPISKLWKLQCQKGKFDFGDYHKKINQLS